MNRLHRIHYDVIKWKHFPRYWPFMLGIHRSPVGSPHKGHWRGALIFSLICAWTNSWTNSRNVGDLRRNRDHYDVTVMYLVLCTSYCRCEVLKISLTREVFYSMGWFEKSRTLYSSTCFVCHSCHTKHLLIESVRLLLRYGPHSPYVKVPVRISN